MPFKSPRQRRWFYSKIREGTIVKASRNMHTALGTEVKKNDTLIMGGSVTPGLPGWQLAYDTKHATPVLYVPTRWVKIPRHALSPLTRKYLNKKATLNGARHLKPQIRKAT